jgi:hypothetical protein
VYILIDFPKFWHKANNIFMYVGWVSFSWFYTFLDLMFVLGGPLKGIKSRFLCARETVIILRQYHYFCTVYVKRKLGQRTVTSAILECEWRKCISEVVMTIKYLSFQNTSPYGCARATEAGSAYYPGSIGTAAWVKTRLLRAVHVLLRLAQLTTLAVLAQLHKSSARLPGMCKHGHF